MLTQKQYERRKTLEHCEFYSQEYVGCIEIRSTKYEDPYMFKYKDSYYNLETLEPMFNKEVTKEQKQEVQTFVKSTNKHGFKDITVLKAARYIWKTFQSAKEPLPQN